MSFQDFTLLPADDPQSSASDDLAAAASAALTLGSTPIPNPAPAAAPLGVSWSFDWRIGQFRRAGQSPVMVSELATLAEWCEMTTHVARYSTPLVSDKFGMEHPDSVIGEFADGETVADWQAALIDALLVHDRISSVANIDLDWDATTGLLTILTLEVITDEDEAVTVSDVTLRAGGA